MLPLLLPAVLAPSECERTWEKLSARVSGACISRGFLRTTLNLALLVQSKRVHGLSDANSWQRSRSDGVRVDSRLPWKEIRQLAKSDIRHLDIFVMEANIEQFRATTSCSQYHTPRGCRVSKKPLCEARVGPEHSFGHQMYLATTFHPKVLATIFMGD